MPRSSITGPRLVALFLLGCVLFNYPLLYLFNSHQTVLGIPVLYAYLFSSWFALIALMALVIELRRDKP